MCQCGGLTEILDSMQGQDSWKGLLKAKGEKQKAACAFDLGGGRVCCGGGMSVCSYPLTDCEPAAAFLRSCFF